MTKTQKQHAIDMVFVIPSELLEGKDSFDLRYFYKRAYIIGLVSAALQKDFGAAAELRYEYLNGNPLCPVVSFHPGKGENDGAEGRQPTLSYRIRIIPCAPEDFPKTKPRLGSGLIRKGGAGEAAGLPTPFYNSTLTAEGCFFTYLHFLQRTEKRCSAFRNACLLGRTWLQQRGLGSDISQGGFGCFEWSLLLGLLLQGGDKKGNAALSPSLSSTQLFKAMVQFLSVTNLAEKPCILGSSTVEDEVYGHGPVIWDSGRQLNIAFKMSWWSATQLYQQARWTRSLLNDNAVDQFRPTFILKADFPLHCFDLVARVNHLGAFEAEELDHRSKTWTFGSKVYDILKRALSDEELGERARLIHIRIPELVPWQVTESPKQQDASGVEVGILFNPTNMNRTVDRGPAAGPSTEEKEKCERFRQFWGHKAELRRFEGGTIRETVIWTSTTPFELCEEITRYVLNQHLGIGALEGDLSFYGHGLLGLLPIKPTDSAMFNAARKAFVVFERDIRELGDLPLHVRQIAPICPELRHASVKPPSLGPAKSGPQPMEAVISFEASGKWPDNLAAIQRTKIAFLLMISRLLEERKEGQLTTWVGLENAKSEMENLAFLDVIYESGVSFRLRIQSDLEETLLERQAKDKSQEQHIRTKTAALLSTFKRLHTNLPLHTQTITTFATRFPALSPTIRLLKHWFNSHKLTSHFTDEFLELVALHIFISPYPWDAPSSANTGFFRVLVFLAHWDWRSEPLVLDTGGDMTPADRSTVATRLEAWRKIDPNMNHTVLFVATAHDATGLAYTAVNGHAKPIKVAATRMTALAKSACRAVKEQGFELDPRILFVPSLKDYEVLIHLSSKAVKDAMKTYLSDKPEDLSRIPAKHSKFKNLDDRIGHDPLPLAQHPTQLLLKRLSEMYSEVLVFFHGAPEDVTVGAIWNPQVQKKKFRVNMPSSYWPVPELAERIDSDDEGKDEGDEVELNKGGVVAEIARIGGDLIDRIEVKDLERGK